MRAIYGRVPHQDPGLLGFDTGLSIIIRGKVPECEGEPHRKRGSILRRVGLEHLHVVLDLPVLHDLGWPRVQRRAAKQQCSEICSVWPKDIAIQYVCNIEVDAQVLFKCKIV